MVLVADKGNNRICQSRTGSTGTYEHARKIGSGSYAALNTWEYIYFTGDAALEPNFNAHPNYIQTKHIEQTHGTRTDTDADTEE
jgi:hypothetical protein